VKEFNIIFFVSNLAIAVLNGVLMPLFPILTRKSFLFGVKIPAEQQGCSEAKAMKKNYNTICLSGTVVLIMLIIIQYIFIPDFTLTALMYFPFLCIVVLMAAYIPNWKKAVKLKEEREWKVSATVFADTKSSHSRGNLSELPWGWYIFSIVLIIASLIIAFIQYPGLPDKIPTHFDANMQPNVWSDKSLSAVLMMPLINISTFLILWFTGFMFVRARYQIDQQNPELSFTQHRIYRRRLGHSIGFLTAGLTIMMAFNGLMTIFPNLYVPFWSILALLFISTVPLLIVATISGQGGCRIKPKGIAIGSAYAQNGLDVSNVLPGRGDDKYWALGMFYHNPDDPAYLVESRFGNKLGFNYSRLPVKIGVIILVIGLILFYAWIPFALFPGL